MFCLHTRLRERLFKKNLPLLGIVYTRKFIQTMKHLAFLGIDSIYYPFEGTMNYKKSVHKNVPFLSHFAYLFVIFQSHLKCFVL